MFKIDALSPALKSLEVSGGELLAAPSSCLEKAGAAATEGAARTASMVARAGRASYVSRDKVREDTQKQNCNCKALHTLLSNPPLLLHPKHLCSSTSEKFTFAWTGGQTHTQNDG